LIGGSAQLLIQVPSLFGVGFRYRPLINWRDPDLRRVILLLGPSVIGVAAVQVNVFVNNWFASFFGNGAVTFLNCAFRLMQFPIGLFGVAISVATLPTVSALAARGDTAAFRQQVARSIRLALFLCIPAACGLAVLAEPIIGAIYQHGRFDATATAQTAWCLRAYAIGLAGYAALKVLAPTFYALGDSRTPALVSLGSIVVNIALCWLFSMRLGLGAPGLALSTSVVALTNFLLLLALMRRKIQRIEIRTLLGALVKIVLATALMSAAAYAADSLVTLNRYLDVLIAITVAVIVYGAAGKLLRIDQLGELIGVFRFHRAVHEEHDR
jgi:putative peptidoglycan lipid II flippase